MPAASCKHVSAYRNRQSGRAKFSRLQRALLMLWRKDDRLEDRQKQSRQHPVVCMLCACASTTCAQHKQQHYTQAKNGHELAVDLQHDQLYCGACDAYIHDPLFEAAVKAAHAMACSGTNEQSSAARCARQAYAESVQTMPVLLKRKRHQTGCEHHPAKKAKQLHQDKLHAPAVTTQADTAYAFGLRGLNNLGNTCFMNSILQVFVHVPLLQAYFLGGGHMHKLCPRLTPPDKPGKCLSCELDNVFSETYSGQQLPFSPVKFLDTWWRSAEGSLAGYQQQDAHEFYLSLLDGLSQPTERSTTPSMSGSLSPGPTSKSATPLLEDVDGGLLGSAPSLDVWTVDGTGAQQAASPVTDLATSSSSGLESLHSRQEEDMESTMDQIFGGILRSDVVCATCGYTSTAHDPFKDISVDIPEVLKHIPQPPHVDTPKPNPVKSGRGRGNGRGSNGKFSAKAGRGAGIAGVKRRAEILFQKEWEAATEGSEPALSDTSGFPATTEASIRCSSVDEQSSVAGHVESAEDQTVSSPLHHSATLQGPADPDHAPDASSCRPKTAATGAKLPFFSAKTALQHKVAAADEAVGGGDKGRQDDDMVNQAVMADDKGGQHEASATTYQGSIKGFLLGPGTQKGSTQGQRPSTAPASPGLSSGKIQKPMRCQKCHTCWNKQLKKQCLRNKALNSPTKKNIDDALQGGVDAAELTPILPPHLQLHNSSSRASRDSQTTAAAAGPKLAPVLHSSKHRQAALLKQKPAQKKTSNQQKSGSEGLSQSQGSDMSRPQEQPEAKSSDPQYQSQGSGRPRDNSQGVSVVTRPPQPMPVKADPDSQPPPDELAQGAADHQYSHHQQQQQQDGATGGVRLARQARESFERSVSQQEIKRAGIVAGDSGAVLLQACLHRFVRPETLHRWVCSRCECERTAVKQMSIRQLPPVLCLHMKRFKATEKGATKKVESPVAFPVAHLDMAPFTSAPVLAARCHLKGTLLTSSSGQKGALAEDASHGSTAYRLHAVVCHMGNLLGGHYIGYVRCGEHWYQFDDARVTLVPEEYVRMSSAYMLFYLQQ